MLRATRGDLRLIYMCCHHMKRSMPLLVSTKHIEHDCKNEFGKDLSRNVISRTQWYWRNKTMNLLARTPCFRRGPVLAGGLGAGSVAIVPHNRAEVFTRHSPQKADVSLRLQAVVHSLGAI